MCGYPQGDVFSTSQVATCDRDGGWQSLQHPAALPCLLTGQRTGRHRLGRQGAGWAAGRLRSPSLEARDPEQRPLAAWPPASPLQPANLNQQIPVRRDTSSTRQPSQVPVHGSINRAMTRRHRACRHHRRRHSPNLDRGSDKTRLPCRIKHKSPSLRERQASLDRCDG